MKHSISNDTQHHRYNHLFLTVTKFLFLQQGFSRTFFFLQMRGLTKSKESRLSLRFRQNDEINCMRRLEIQSISLLCAYTKVLFSAVFLKSFWFFGSFHLLPAYCHRTLADWRSSLRNMLQFKVSITVRVGQEQSDIRPLAEACVAFSKSFLNRPRTKRGHRRCWHRRLCKLFIASITLH